MAAAQELSVRFRKAGPVDVDLVIELLHELIVELGPPDNAAQVLPQLSKDIHLALAADNVCIFLVESAGKAIGLSRGDILASDPIFRLRTDNRCGYVDQMYVRPTYRNQGLGRQLLHLVENWFREQGIGHALLHAAQNALRFYSTEDYVPNREMFKRL